MMKKTFLAGAAVLLTALSFGQCDHTIDATNPTCNGFSDGSVTVIPTGGSGSYTITIEDASGTVISSTGSTGNSLPEGWYFTFLDDGAGCTDEDSVYLDDGEPMDPVILLTNPSFPGACDGVAECDTVLNYTGSFSAIYYAWTPPGPMGPGETIWTSVCAGSYGLLLNDENGCAVTEDFDIGSLVGIDETNNNLELLNLNESKTIIVKNTYSLGSLGLNIYNLAGQQVDGFIIEPGSNEFNVQHLAGLYVYTISENGKTVKSGKLNF